MLIALFVGEDVHLVGQIVNVPLCVSRDYLNLVVFGKAVLVVYNSRIYIREVNTAVVRNFLVQLGQNTLVLLILSIVVLNRVHIGISGNINRVAVCRFFDRINRRVSG